MPGANGKSVCEEQCQKEASSLRRLRVLTSHRPPRAALRRSKPVSRAASCEVLPRSPPTNAGRLPSLAGSLHKKLVQGTGSRMKRRAREDVRAAWRSAAIESTWQGLAALVGSGAGQLVARPPPLEIRDTPQAYHFVDDSLE